MVGVGVVEQLKVLSIKFPEFVDGFSWYVSEGIQHIVTGGLATVCARFNVVGLGELHQMWDTNLLKNKWDDSFTLGATFSFKHAQPANVDLNR